MILTSDIVNTLKAHLDAEGSEYYTWDNDYKYAINRAIDFVTSLFNAAFAQKKLSEENLRELLSIKVHKLSTFSTLTFTPAESDAIWTVTAIYPKAEIDPNFDLSGYSNLPTSQLIPTRFLGSDYDAKRLTQEQWAKNKDNYFSSGNALLTGDLASYAFMNFADFGQAGFKEIPIRPKIPNELVGVGILNFPTHVTAEIDSIPFPDVLKNMLVDKALFYISYKQGDQTTAAAVTDKEVKELITLMV